MRDALTTTSHAALIRAAGLAQLRRSEIVLRGPPNATFAYTAHHDGRMVVREAVTDATGTAYIRFEDY